jgi:hypothetical protein
MLEFQLNSEELLKENVEIAGLAVAELITLLLWVRTHASDRRSVCR